MNGVLWHAAFAHPCAPIFQLPEFAGKPNFNGLMNQPGYYVDPARREPGLGTVVLSSQSMQRSSFSLKASIADSADWSSHNTEAALHAMCDYWNDEYNRTGVVSNCPNMRPNYRAIRRFHHLMLVTGGSLPSEPWFILNHFYSFRREFAHGSIAPGR